MFDSQLLWNFFAPILMALPRVSAAIIVAPLFPRTIFPTFLRSAIAVSLSLYLYPHMLAAMPTAVPLLLGIGLLAKEALIGALIGFALGTVVWAFQSAGSVLDFQIGLSNAQVFDPFGGHEGGPMGQLMLQIGLILLLAAGGLQVLATLLFESFRLWPVASFYPSARRLTDFSGDSIGSFAELFARLVAPPVLLLALVDLGFGLVNRVAPQLNTYFFTMPIKGALAALVLALYLSYLSDIVTAHVAGLQHLLEHLRAVLSIPTG